MNSRTHMHSSPQNAITPNKVDAITNFAGNRRGGRRAGGGRAARMTVAGTGAGATSFCRDVVSAAVSQCHRSIGPSWIVASDSRYWRCPAAEGGEKRTSLDTASLDTAACGVSPGVSPGVSLDSLQGATVSV